jgi:hypothetical protein
MLRKCLVLTKADILRTGLVFRASALDAQTAPVADGWLYAPWRYAQSLFEADHCGIQRWAKCPGQLLDHLADDREHRL